MTAPRGRIVTVFGGIGFLGRRIALHLRQQGIRVRIASRHPDRWRGWFGADDPEIQLWASDIHDGQSVADAMRGAYGAVNATSLYVERGRETFQSVHVEAAERLARLAQRAGVQRLVHVSGVGSDAASPSLYIRKRGEGEQVVQAAFADAILMRPTVMFGPGDAFLTPVLNLLRRFPVYPMFGDGRTKLQPVYVEDVAEAVTRALLATESRAITYECGGPSIYSYKGLLRTLAETVGSRAILLPLPFAAWHVMAWIAEILPNPPITRNQVELMKVDNVSATDKPGLADLGISPRAIEAEVRSIMRKVSGIADRHAADRVP